MKKLMIAAAAAAMVGGAFAADEMAEPKYNLRGTTTLLGSQVFQYKTKAVTDKAINLDGDKKSFGKTLKYTTASIDGVYYYDSAIKKWIGFKWSKGVKPIQSFTNAPEFSIFENDEKNKAIAVYGGYDVDDATGHAETYRSYGALKYVTVKTDDGKKVKVLNETVTSLKDLTGYYKYTIKTFKDKVSKSSHTPAEELAKEYVKKLVEKAEKAVKK